MEMASYCVSAEAAVSTSAVSSRVTEWRPGVCIQGCLWEQVDL